MSLQTLAVERLITGSSTLDIGTIADQTFFKRDGYAVIGSTPTGAPAQQGKENLSSQITGSQTIFTTAVAYVAGSLQVFLNGLHLGCSGDGFSEKTDKTFEVTTHVPQVGELLVVVYWKK